MNKTHNIKIREGFADAVLSGEKTFEVRENDRGYQKGDFITFTVIDNLNIIISHPLDEETYLITYVLSGWGIEENKVVFSIKNTKELF